MRAAIFDLDDTLYPYEAFVTSGFEAVGHYVATLRPVSFDDVAARLQGFRDGPHRGYEFQALCAELELSPAIVPRLVHVFRAHRPRLRLAWRATATLTELRGKGWRLGILTNGLAVVQRGKVRALGVEALVDAVTYAEEHADGGKPAAAAFDAVTRELGVERTRAVMVGNDLECDVQGARRAGLHAIHVRPPETVADGRAVRLADLIDVPALAERLIPAEAVCVH